MTWQKYVIRFKINDNINMPSKININGYVLYICLESRADVQ